MFQQSLVNRFCLVREFQAQQKSPTTHADYRLNFVQELTQISFDLLNIFEHAVPFNRFQRRRYRSHRDHAASERRPEIIFLDMRRDLFSHQTGTYGNAATELLRQSDNVGNHSITRFAARENPFAPPADSSLYFVIDQDDAALFT